MLLTDGTGKRLREIAAYLGEATNNVAESCALIVALQEALRLGRRNVAVLTDSEVLSRHVTGVYRVKNQQLQWLHVLIRHLVEGFDRFEIRHVPRDENRLADRLANRAVSQELHRRPVAKKSKPPSSAVPTAQPTFW